MIFEHQALPTVAMPCHKCRRYAHDGVHLATDCRYYHPHCCPAPACVAKYGKAVPLAEGEIKLVVGTQEGLFDA